MCGLAGIWGSCDDARLSRMISPLRHRGPDAEGILSGERYQLGHCRLSIVDLTNGDQPFANEDGRLALVANGEIYNAQALRASLPSRHVFRSHSDCEVVLHSFEELGAALVEQLDGMFAFVIASPESYCAARDPLGIKPLYFVEHPHDGFVFASEIKGLLDWPDRIRPLAPGHWLQRGRAPRRYYRLPSAQTTKLTPAATARVLRETLAGAVRKRLVADVPVGAFLSGGIDSSIVAALACREVDPLHTFAVGMRGSRDLEAARHVAQHLGTIHHEHEYTASDVIHALPRIIHHLESFDVDLVRSAIPCYFAAQLASRYVKVVLTGEGADELLAGYRYHRSLADNDALDTELRQSVEALHDMNLQRVDRMTMAHSLEGRVPFLDLEVVRLGLSIPAALKVRGAPPTEKWILRQAADGLLPPEIVWRRKEQFDEGSGTVDFLREGVRLFAKRFGSLAPRSARLVGSEGRSTPEVTSSNATGRGGAASPSAKRAPVRTPEPTEANVYRRLFRNTFPPEVDHLVGKWRGRQSVRRGGRR